MNQQRAWGVEPEKGDEESGWSNSLLAEENKMGGRNKGKRNWGKRGKKNKSDKMDWVDWTRVLELQESEALIYAEVTEFNQGGLLVRGQEIEGFVPRSHLIANKANRTKGESFLKAYVGTELELKVIECDPERGRIVLSERAAKSRPGSRQVLLDTLSVGQRIEGVVTNITPFGLFVDLGGIEGLVHISELSWGRVTHPREVAKPNDRIEVVVLELDPERGRVSLSLKQSAANPWDEASKNFPEGFEMEAEITEVVHFGAFARLAHDLEGLIHISEMDLHHRLDPRLVLESGMKVQVRVLQVEVERQRMSLKLLGKPWEDDGAPEPDWLDTPGERD